MATQRAPKGEAQRFFEEAMLLETDDCILWPYAKDYNGYGMAMVDGRTSTVHRHALIRSSGEERVGLDAAHSCPEKSCFNPRHLSWKTRRENHLDKRRDGTAVGGRSAPGSAFTPETVRAARRRFEGGERIADIARSIGADWSTVNAVVRRRSWAWVDDEPGEGVPCHQSGTPRGDGPL